MLQDQYIHRGEGFLIIYSINSRASYELVTKFQQKIFMVKDEDTHYPMVTLLPDYTPPYAAPGYRRQQVRSTRFRTRGYPVGGAGARQVPRRPFL